VLARAAVGELDGGARRRRPPTRYRLRWIGSDRRHRVLARSKRLLGVKTLLAGLSVGFSIYIVWEMTAPFGSSVDTPPAPVSAAVVEPDIALRATPAVYASIGSRNLFSPTRSDTQKVDPAVAAIAAMRLNLFGVVFRRSVHRLSEGSRQQAGVRLPARGFSGRWNHPGDRVEPHRPRAAESAAGGAAPPRSLAAEAEPARRRGLGRRFRYRGPSSRNRQPDRHRELRDVVHATGRSATGRSATRYQLRHRGARRSTGPMSTIRGVTLIDGVLPL